MDLDALAAALEQARRTGNREVFLDELAAQGWRRLSRHLPTPEEFRSLVDVDPVTNCWLWRGRLDAGGYGIWAGQAAHRVSYRVFLGSIPPGRHIDHLCRVRNCVNAVDGHLEAVSQAENTRRAVAYIQRFPEERVHNGAKRWCRHGHRLDKVNAGIDSLGKRYCKTCRATQLQSWRKEVAGLADRGREFHIDAHRWLAARAALSFSDSDDTISTAEAAALCGLSPDAFRHWRRRNPTLLSPAGSSTPRRARWLRREVEALVSFQTTEPWSRLRNP